MAHPDRILLGLALLLPGCTAEPRGEDPVSPLTSPELDTGDDESDSSSGGGADTADDADAGTTEGPPPDVDFDPAFVIAQAQAALDAGVPGLAVAVVMDGRIVFAGAHEDLVVLRARTGVCEQIETRGPWLGVVPDVRRSAVDDELRLDPGDTLLLYTDGLTEASNAEGEQFGIERVCAALASAPARSARGVLEHLLSCLRGFTTSVADDITALVLRYGDGAREA